MSDPVRRIPGEPPLATNEWRRIVTAAAMRCQCTGQCGARHDKARFNDSPDRCVKALDRRRDFTELVTRVGLHALEPGAPLAAVCEACYDGLARGVRRRKRERLTRSQSETLFDYLSEGGVGS